MTGAAGARPGASFADPTLLALARGGSRWAQLGLAVIGASVVIGLLSVTVLRPGKPKGGGARVQVAATSVASALPGLRLDYARGELRVASASRSGVALVDRGDDPQGSRLYVTPLTLAAYKGSPTGALPLATVAAQATIRPRFDPGSTRFIDEGLVNVGPNPGYQLSYVAKLDGKTWYGRAAIVLPDVDGDRRAVLMDGEEESGGLVVSPRAVGRQGDLRRPMRSLVFLR